ncbi:ethanolamine utilization protein EutE, partial [Salmonella enterica]|nr:ethanolamine utilization protein EutE [Salmonella enterica]
MILKYPKVFMEVMDMIGAYAKRGEALSKREQYVFAAVLLY